ncbi:MAG: hypothetical protein HY645_13370 [Acidobacteria bacterium]|nr:hypothetical protein [Acidobacteriota bacterium]
MRIDEYSRSAGEFRPVGCAEELPAYVVFDQEQEPAPGYIATVLEEITTDDYCAFPELLHAYRDSDEVGRSFINFTLVTLCGWSLPNLIRLAHGEKPE